METAPWKAIEARGNVGLDSRRTDGVLAWWSYGTPSPQSSPEQGRGRRGNALHLLNGVLECGRNGVMNSVKEQAAAIRNRAHTRNLNRLPRRSDRRRAIELGAVHRTVFENRFAKGRSASCRTVRAGSPRSPEKDCCGETSQPTLETSALPGTLMRDAVGSQTIKGGSHSRSVR